MRKRLEGGGVIAKKMEKMEKIEARVALEFLGEACESTTASCGGHPWS